MVTFGGEATAAEAMAATMAKEGDGLGHRMKESGPRGEGFERIRFGS